MFQFFKKMRKKWSQAVEETVNQWNGSLEEMKIQPELEDNITACQRIFADMDIIRYKTIKTEGKGATKYFIAFSDGLVDSAIINDNIIKPLMTLAPATPAKGESMMQTLLKSVVQVGEARTAGDFKELVLGVTSGDTALFVDGCNQVAILNTKQITLRAVTEPENEKVISGPRDGFNESLIQNLTQVTRRIRTNELKTKMMTLGRRTHTSICVCYLDSVVDKSILTELIERLNKIDIDGVLDSNYITELIRDCKLSTFRTTGYTERPDVIVAKLLEGRIAIFVDGTPTVLTVPYLFIENFQSNEDYYFVYFYSTFARLLRMAGFVLTVAVPGFYISAVAFHQEMLPLQLLMRIALERRSVPLPAALEALIMLFVFDILRETGVRMPATIGQTLSIVGALVIGQAAVQARLVAAPMIIMVAFTGITGILVPKLNSPIIYWRLLLLTLASTFGYFGLAIGIALMITHIQNLTSMGVEQTSLTGNLRLQDMKDIFVRAPWGMMKQRPSHLTQNVNREAGGASNG